LKSVKHVLFNIGYITSGVYSMPKSSKYRLMMHIHENGSDSINDYINIEDIT